MKLISLSQVCTLHLPLLLLTTISCITSPQAAWPVSLAQLSLLQLLAPPPPSQSPVPPRLHTHNNKHSISTSALTAPQKTRANPLWTLPCPITMVAVTTPTWCHMPVTWLQATEEAVVVVTLRLRLPLRTLPSLPPNRSRVLVRAAMAVLSVLPQALWPATNQGHLYPLSMLTVTAHWVSLASLNRVLTSITSRQLCNLMFNVLLFAVVSCAINYFIVKYTLLIFVSSM